MATSFFQCLNASPSDLFGDQNFIVIHDNEHMDGSVFMHNTVSSFLSSFGDSSRVVLLLDHESSRCWNSKALKAGYNLADFERKKSVKVLDICETRCQLLLDRGTMLTSGVDERNNSIDSLWEPNGNLNSARLFQMLEKTIIDVIESQESPAAKKVLVVVEDFTSLFHECGNSSAEKSLIVFVRRLRQLYRCKLQERDQIPDISIVTRVNSSHKHQIQSMFSSTIAFSLADYIIDVHPLKTGASSDVTGKISVFTKSKSKLHSEATIGHGTCAKAYHFKVEDRSVKVTPL